VEKTRSDHVLAIVKAGVAAVPVVGGTVSSLIGDYIPSATQKAIEQSIEFLRVRLEAYGARVDTDSVRREEFAELFKSAYLVMARSHNEVKLRAAAGLVANILLRPSDPDRLSYTELDHFARALDALSSGALTVLGHCFSIARRTEPENIEHRSSEITFEQLSTRMAVDPDLLMGLVSELTAHNLMRIPSVPTVQLPDYKNYSFHLTAMGARFTARLLRP